MIFRASLLATVSIAMLLVSCNDATCADACDNIYACMPETTTPKAECVSKCETDPGKGNEDNRNCIADASCEDLSHGVCPDLIVR